MKKFFVLFFLLPSLLYSHVDLLFSDDEDLTLYHHVNVISGNLNLYFEDAIVRGAQPLSLIRTYSSAGALERNYENTDEALKKLYGRFTIQGGWNLIPHSNLIVQVAEREQDFKVFLPEKSGSLITYRFSHRENDLAVFKPQIEAGQCSGILSARNNPENNLLKINLQKYQATLFLPDGGSRYYSKSRSFLGNPLSEDFCLYLKSEFFPNSFRNEYSYDEYGNLFKISSMNFNKTRCYSSIDFKVINPGAGSHHFRFQAVTSDGKFFDYHSINFKLRNYLGEVRSNCLPHESAHYVPGRKGIGARMHSLDLSGYKQFNVEYIKPPNKKLEKKWAENSKKKFFSVDKVHSLEAPIGPGGQMLPIAYFIYGPGLTEVRDEHRILTRYRHDQIRLHVIEYCDENDQLYSFLRLMWEGNRLKAKALLGAQSQAVFAKTFKYDALGNVLEEILWGNLTGHAPEYFTLNPDGSLEGAESYRKWYSYLPGFNIPIIEEEEEGLTYRYSYKLHSNLLSAKFTCDKEKILIRQFWFYNEDNLLIKEINDNGCTNDPNDLTNVTERQCKCYELDSTTSLPKSISELYWDSESNFEKLLKKTEYTYSPQKQVIGESVYDANEVFRYRIDINYNAHGRVILRTTPLGQSNTYVYDIFGNLLESKEVGSPKKIYHYNPMGQPIRCEEIDFEGNRTTSMNNYDSKGRLLSQTDARGNTTAQQYDAFGRCLKTQFPKVKNSKSEGYAPIIQFTYDIQGNLTSTTTPRNEIKQTIYNSLKKPIQIIEPDGNRTLHFYNKHGSLLKTIYSDGTQVQYTNDLLQRMTSKTLYSEDGQLLSQETWEYDAFHLVSYTDSKGLCTNYEYDGAGRLKAEKSQDREKHFVYDALGFVERTTDGNLSQVKIHDEKGRVIEEWIEDQNGQCENHMTFLYDQEDRKIQASRMTSQGMAVDHFVYDGQGRLTQHEDPLGAITQFIYTEMEQDDFSQQILKKTTIDPCGNTTIETYDALNHLVTCEKKNPMGRTVAKEEFLYDLSGNRSNRIVTVYQNEMPIKTICTFWEHDACGRVVKEVEANQKVTLSEYDCRGRLKARILPSQVILSYSYDGLDRLTEMSSSDHSIQYQYFYEKGSSPTKIIDLNQNTTLVRSYNDFGQIIEEINPCGLHCQWEYDSYGRCTHFILPDGSSIASTYVGGHLSAVQRHSRDGKNLYEHRYLQFDPNGHVQKEQLVHTLGCVSTEHDLLERPIFQSSPFFQQSISYGPSGLVNSVENSFFGNKQYAYDPLNQLTQEGNQSYSFDSLGNPSDCKVNDCNQILSSPMYKLSYDADGNPLERSTSEGTIFYRYDALGRLIEMNQPLKKVRYFYDAHSRLLYKESEMKQGRTWVYDKKFYLYDREVEIGTVSENQTIRELKILGLGIKGDIGAAVAIEIDREVFVPQHDFNGHIIALLSPSGKVFEKYQLNAFGKEKESSNPKNPWRFSSKRSEEGLVFFGKRFYDPALGRWLTPDPAGDVEGPNVYLYVLNNPLNRLDLFGLKSDLVFPWTENHKDLNIEIDISRIPNHSNFKEALICHGSVGEIEVDWVIACNHWHRLQFSPEELKAGKVNIADHFHEILPKDGTIIGIVSGQNGINNNLGEFKAMSQSINDKISESTFYVGMHNPTLGVISDLKRVRQERSGKDTPIVCRTRQFLEALVDHLHNINPSLLWMHISHSEGGLIFKRAQEGMTPEHQELLKKHLLSVSMGPAHPIPLSVAKRAVNIYSKQDHVTKRFAEPFLNDPGYDIRVVDSTSKISEKTLYFADHAIMGTTYQKNLQTQLDQAREVFGFYDDQKR